MLKITSFNLDWKKDNVKTVEPIQLNMEGYFHISFIKGDDADGMVTCAVKRYPKSQ